MCGHSLIRLTCYQLSLLRNPHMYDIYPVYTSHNFVGIEEVQLKLEIPLISER
jgi:hypothetical protein